MADKTDKLKAGLLKDILKQMKGANEQFEKIAQTEMEAAAEGKGFISGTFAKAKARERIAQEYMMATKGAINKRQAIFDTLGLEKVGKMVEVFFPGEKTEPPAELVKKFGLDKKSKEGGSGRNLAKPISLILRNILETKKMVKTIEKSLAKASVPKSSRYVFDPRMAGGGRYRDTITNKLVSTKEAQSERTAALTAAIGADEQPLVQLKESLEGKFEELNDSIKDIKKLESTVSGIKFSIDGIIPRVTDLSVHSKLDLILKKSALDDIDVDSPNKRKKTPIRDRLKRLGRGATRLATRAIGVATSAPVVAAAGAAAVVGAGAYALNKGMTAIGDKAKSAMDNLEKKYGIKTTYDAKGNATGYIVNGKKYGLNDLPQEYKDLIAAYGPGDKRNAEAREALARIKKNPEKYKSLELGYKPKAAPAAGAPAPASASAPKPAPAPVAAVTPTALPGSSTVATALSAATSAPVAAGGTGPSSGPSLRLGPAAEARGKVSASDAKNAALAAAAKAGISGAHLAQFMAQLDHESGGFKSVEENLRYSAKRLMQVFPKYYKDPAIAEQESYQPQAIANRVYANRMGNGPPSSGDGYKYRGRGLIQLTGKDNYKRFGSMIGMDLVGNPDMAGNLGTAADIAAAFYKKNVIDKGIDGNDTSKVTKVINGGTNGLSHRESLFASYMKDSGSLMPSGQMLAGGPEPIPSAAAKGQDVKVGGNASGGVAPTESKQQMVASSQSQATPAAAAAPPPAQSLAPVQNTTGTQVAQGSAQLDSSKMVASAAPPPATPVVINNNAGGNKMPPQPPKQPMPMASTRPSENSYNRAMAKDFAHPTAFTSVGMA